MDYRIRNAIALLLPDLQRNVSLHEIAACVNLSTSRFRHLFKAETGMSIVKYLKAQRLRKAKEMLEETTLSIKEIMGRIGINDKSNFARDFKNAYGLSPAQYRKACQNESTKEKIAVSYVIATATNK